MDTREKIIAPDAPIRREGKLCVVVGHFDPVFAPHVRRLRELATACDTLVVIVTNPNEPLLQNRARAELAAALQVVDYVIPAQDNAVEDILAHLRPDCVIHEQEADSQRAAALAAHVRERQNAR